MRKITLLFVVAIIAFASCNKDSSCSFKDSSKTAPENERTAIADSLEKYGIRNALQHPSGLYYVIEEQGSSKFVANLCTAVTVAYRGGFFNGNGFDSSQNATFQLGQVIVGWQKGIPLINEGGKMRLFIPPSLAYGGETRYGPDGKVLIPAQSYLVFDVEVKKIQ